MTDETLAVLIIACFLVIGGVALTWSSRDETEDDVTRADG